MVESDASTKTVAKMEPFFLPLGVQLELAICDQFLLYFDLLYDKFTDSEKKEFLQSFVERVELFPEKQPDGRFLKRIKFRFPVYFDGAEVDGMRWDSKTTVETVVCLGGKK